MYPRRIQEHVSTLKLYLLSSPTDDDIKKMVNTADGLFAYPAAVLHFVAYPTNWRFRERLLEPGKQSPTSPLSQLNTPYVHIMNQIPEDIFPSAQLLHSSSFAVSFPMTHLAMIHLLMIAELAATFSVAAYCSAPAFPESTSTCRDHLRAVFDPLNSIDLRPHLAWSFYDQSQ